MLGYLVKKEKKLKESGKIKTSLTYNLTKKHLETYSKKDKISFLEITPQYLAGLENYLLNKYKFGNKNKKAGLSYSSISIDMRNIRSAFNEAIEDGLVDQKQYPFGRRKYVVPASVKAKKALDLDA